MKQTYHYVGGAKSGMMGDDNEAIELTRFGQEIELQPEHAEERALHNHFPILPASRFRQLGFTEDDLLVGAAAVAADSDPKFATKYAACLNALHEWRDELSSPKPAPPPEAPQAPAAE